MEIWMDTTHPEDVVKAFKMGVLGGITTNPTLIAQNGNGTKSILDAMLHHQEGPVAIQVLAEQAEGMVNQGQMFFDLSDRLIIKIPVTENGLEAIYRLSRQGIPTMATALFDPRQAIMAALAGANYLAPYIGQIEASQNDPWDILSIITKAIQNYKLPTKILGASIKNTNHFVKCAEMGIWGVTLKPRIFEEIISDHPLTLDAIKQFSHVLIS